MVGLPDQKWGERVVVQLRPRQQTTTEELAVSVKDLLGSVKAPKQIAVSSDLSRSKIGEVLEPDVKSELASSSNEGETGTGAAVPAAAAFGRLRDENGQ